MFLAFFNQFLMIKNFCMTYILILLFLNLFPDRFLEFIGDQHFRLDSFCVIVDLHVVVNILPFLSMNI